MKYITIICTFIFVFLIGCENNKDETISTENPLIFLNSTIWKLAYSYEIETPPLFENEYHMDTIVYTFSIDTILGTYERLDNSSLSNEKSTKEYKKLIFNKKSIISGYTDDTIISTGTMGWLRVNDLNKKVYFVERDFPDIETILLDFGVKEGDTIRFLSYSHPVVVSSIDAFNLGKYTLKRIRLNNSWDFDGNMIEGIGSSSGLFNMGNYGTLALYKWISLYSMEINGEVFNKDDLNFR